MKLSKYSILSVLVILVVLLITGCHYSPEQVRLANKREILKFAKTEYGSAEYIDKNYTSKRGNDSITYRLKDKQYNFEYTIETYVNIIGFNAAVFWYAEDKTSSFGDEYRRYIIDGLHDYIENKEVNLSIKIDTDQDINTSFFAVVYTTENTDIDMVIKFLSELGNKVLEIDTRGFWSESKITLMDTDGETEIGAFVFDKAKYLTDLEQSIDWYMDSAASIMETDIDNLQYRYCEVVNVNDVIGLSNENIVNILGTNMEDIECYYFTYNNKEYFIASINVTNSDGGMDKYIYNLTDRVSVTGKFH